MFRSDNVTSHFIRITCVRGQLATIGEKVDDVELVNVELNGLPKSWEPFVKGVCTRKSPPYCRGFGMIVSKKRLERILNPTSKVVVMRTWPFLVRQGREK
jgi:hypothetical protein